MRSFVLRSIAPIVLIALLLPVPAPAADPAAQPGGGSSDADKPDNAVLRRQVEELIGRLDADSREARISAEQELLRLGPGVLPFLPPPELTPNVTVREAVRRIRIALEHEKARESVRPSQVTLTGTMTFQAALVEIERQTGNRVDPSLLSDVRGERTVTVDFNRTMYWKAMEELSGQTEPQRKQGRIRTASGPFSIEILSAERRPIFGNDKQQLIRIELNIVPEPRLRPLFLKYAATDLELRPTGVETALDSFNPDAQYEIPPGDRDRGFPVQLDFKLPAERKIDALALDGKLTTLIAAATEQIEFKGVATAKGVARRRGGITVLVKDAAFHKTPAGGHDATIRAVISYDEGGPAFESHRTWILHNQAFLDVKGGGPLRFDGYETTLQADGLVAIEYRFDGLKENPADYRFVYEAPTLLIDVPIEFALPGIILTGGDESR